jgi:hypothetical protein
MLSNNNNNTIIENIEYLDMDDPKNSWYFDAERFDVNFPLVRSYRSKVKWASEELFQEWYEYWDAIFSYYANMPGTFGICFTLDTNPGARGHVENNYFTHSEDSVYPESWFKISSRIDSAFTDIKLFTYSKQRSSNGKVNTYVLVIVKDSGGLADLRKKLCNSFFYSRGRMGFLSSYLHSQLIISKDWDLLKRYFFFMIRNHQYKGSKFMYTVGKSKSENADILAFTDVREGVAFSELPVDFRFGQTEYTNDSEDSMVESHEVVFTDRKLTQTDLE